MCFLLLPAQTLSSAGMQSKPSSLHNFSLRYGLTLLPNILALFPFCENWGIGFWYLDNLSPLINFMFIIIL